MIYNKLQRFFQLILNLVGTSRGMRHIVQNLSNFIPSMRSYPVELIDGSHLILDLKQGMSCHYFLHGCLPHEMSEVKILKKLTKLGDVFIDVGANVGFYTALARKWVGPSGLVVAFEPNIRCVELMKKSFNSDPNVIIVPKALGSERKMAKIYIPSLGDLATLDIARRDAKYVDDIEVIKLDDFIRETSLRPPSLIKIDVEGYEMSVIQGMRGLLAGSQPPIIAFEHIESFLADYEASLPKLIDYVQSTSNNAYRFYRVDYDGKLRKENIEVPTAQNDIVAVPEIRSDDLNDILLS